MAVSREIINKMFLTDGERAKLSADRLFQKRKDYVTKDPPGNNNLFNGILNTVTGAIAGFVSGGPVGAVVGAGTGLARSISQGNSDPEGRVEFDPLGNATQGYGAGMIPSALDKGANSVAQLASTDKSAGISPQINLAGHDPKDLLTVARGFQSGDMIGTASAINDNARNRLNMVRESKKLAAEMKKADLELVKTAQEVADYTGIDRTVSLSDGSEVKVSQSPKVKLSDQKTRVDIMKTLSDIEIAKEKQAVDKLNSQLSRENNAIKRQELQLKIQERQDKLDSAIKTKAAELSNARANIDNMISTTDQILNYSESKEGMKIAEAATGPISSRIGTITKKTADFEELVDLMRSQSFLAQIPAIKGTGALSDTEGKKLETALQNLKLRQSKEQLFASVKEARRLILKARQNLSLKYSAQDTIPDAPSFSNAQQPKSKPPSETEIEALIQKYSNK